MTIYKMSKKTEEETLERMRKRLNKKTEKTRKLDAIKRRLERATSLDTNTDEKLGNGAIMDSVEHGDADIAWLLERVDELVKGGRRMLIPYDSDPADLEAAINRTLNAED